MIEVGKPVRNAPGTKSRCLVVFPCVFIIALVLVGLQSGARADEEIALRVGETRLMSVKPVSRVAVGHAGVVDVRVVTPTELLLVAKGEGKTVVHLWPQDGPPVERSVRVMRPDPVLSTGDLAAMVRDEGVNVRLAGGFLVLEGEPRKATTYERLARIGSAFGGQILNLVVPEPAVVAESAAGSVNMDGETRAEARLVESAATLLRRAVGDGFWVEVRQGRMVIGGEAADEAQAALVREIAGLFEDHPAVLVSVARPLPRQISVKARVVEIQRSALRELGVEWPAEISFVRSAPPAFGRAGLAPDDVVARLRAYEQAGKARMLAEPNLLVAAGSEGSFLVGGQVPIPIQQESGTTVEWKEYGVRLRVVPALEGENLIRLAIRPEVSTLDWANATKVDGAVLPALRVRSTETVVLQKSGGTVVVAGLLQTLEGDHTTQVPGLVQIPLLGRLFKGPRTSTEDTELAVFVSTTLAEIPGDEEESAVETPPPHAERLSVGGLPRE